MPLTKCIGNVKKKILKKMEFINYKSLTTKVNTGIGVLPQKPRKGFSNFN